MDNLTERLLDPERFEEALQDPDGYCGCVEGIAAIRELHARLRTAKAEGAAKQDDTDRMDWLANIGEFEQQLSASGDIHECQILLPEFEEPFVGYGPNWATAYRAAIDSARAGGGR